MPSPTRSPSAARPSASPRARPSDLEALARELPGAHHPLTCDVALPASIATAIEEFAAAAGGLDLLVANAGVAYYEPIATQSLDKIELMTEVNWLGTVYTVKAALPFLLEAGGGHIVVMSSGAGLRGFPGAAAYSATKAAQRMFAEALRHELAGTGVSVTTVFPGEVRTSLHDHEGTQMPAVVSRRAERCVGARCSRRGSSGRSSATAASCTTAPSSSTWASSTASRPASPTASCAACAARPRRRGAERYPAGLAQTRSRPSRLARYRARSASATT